MLKQITEYNKYVEITGFRNIKIENTPAFLSILNKLLPGDIEIQFSDADFVASWEHLYFAIVNALTAFKNKRNISKSLAVETVLYASAQRQIKKAIDTIGVKPTTRNVAMIIIAENTNALKTGLSIVVQHLGIKPDETVLELSKTKIHLLRHAFDISDTELETATGDSNVVLVNFVIERVALLSTQI